MWNFDVFFDVNLAKLLKKLIMAGDLKCHSTYVGVSVMLLALALCKTSFKLSPLSKHLTNVYTELLAPSYFMGPCYLISISMFIRSISLPNSRFLAATKQLYKWYFLSVRPSVCLSVRPSVRHTFLTMFPSSYHHEIFRSYYQWQKWRPCKRSRSEVKGQGHRGHNPTLPFPDCNSSLNSRMMMKWCI